MNASRLLLLVSCLVVSVAASAQTLTCNSDDMGRHFCRANTSNGVQMIHQRSGSPCTQGYSWGYDSGGIWVDHGCRADFSLGGGGGNGGGTSPQDAQRSCKNTAGERLPNVPLAYISTYRGTDTGDGNYMINFRAQPPNSRVSSGFCIISKNGQLVRFQFDPNAGPGQGGGGYGGTSPQDAMRTCKNTVGERLPQVPLAYISVYRGTDTGNGSYMINFRAQPPNNRVSSGFCIIARNGQMQNFQFDPGSGPYYGGGGSSGKMSPQDAMQTCKSHVSTWAPRVPLAYIYVNQAKVVGGGGYMIPYQLRPPNNPGSDGFCNVSQAGQVEVWSGGRRVQ
jgi:Protein of unknown function (DUF3011)